MSIMRPARSPSTLRSCIDRRLGEIASGFDQGSRPLGAAMAEAVLGSGKRFRGTLVLLAAPPGSARAELLLDAACALEMAHAASLIFDDLPCMDDARTRRGQPAAHLQYGEGRAILAGLGLVTEAMRLLAAARGADRALAAAGLVAVLSQALGPGGLCAGQDLDLHAPKTDLTREQDLKTGALFVAGFQMLALIEALPAPQAARLEWLGLVLGRAFQSYDDLLDAAGSAEALGKDVGRDTDRARLPAGLRAVGSLGDTLAHYRAARETLDAALAACGYRGAPVEAFIAAVLPAEPAFAA